MPVTSGLVPIDRVTHRSVIAIAAMVGLPWALDAYTVGHRSWPVAIATGVFVGCLFVAAVSATGRLMVARQHGSASRASRDTTA